MKCLHRIHISHASFFFVCGLGSVFYFFMFSSELPSTNHNVTQQKISQQSQWWANESINPNCSCTMPWNSTMSPTDRMKCCHRSVVGAHKMGWQLLIKINRNYLARIPGGQVRKSELYTVRHITIQAIDTQNSARNKEYQLLTNLTYQLERDYRTVFVTRNWFDTIISGYLYHKSGRECWLSSGGRGGSSGWLLHFNWEEFLEKERGRTARYWPNLTATNLCKYLQLASPEDGLRVYADLAIAYWLNSVAALANARNVTPPAKNRTLFLCYEQFNLNENFPDAIKEAGSFLYPAEDIAQWNGIVSTNQGGGGHATTKDNATRMGLHALLRSIDSEHFDGEIKAGSLKFGCSSEADNNLTRSKA